LKNIDRFSGYKKKDKVLVLAMHHKDKKKRLSFSWKALGWESFRISTHFIADLKKLANLPKYLEEMDNLFKANKLSK